MKNSRNALYREAAALLDGLNKHANLPVTHVTADTLESAITAARTASAQYEGTKVATRTARRDLREVNQAAQRYATVCRDAWRAAFGNTHSPEWARVGWKTSLSTPTSPIDVVELFHALTRFLTDHVDFANEKFNVSAAGATQHLNTLEEAIKAARDAKSDQRSKRDARDGAEEALVQQIRCVQKELQLILKPQDPRWVDFVDAVPADAQRPEPVEGLEVEAGEPGELDADWEASARADRYLVEVQVVGQDAAFRRVTTVRDTNATLTGLPPGAQVKVRVLAANDAGESAPSAEVAAQLPTLANAA
jgi:hypothetical protein